MQQASNAWIVKSMKSYIYFHSRCFDAIVSSVLTIDCLELAKNWQFVGFEPVDYDSRRTWLSTDLKQPCVVLDFLYHPQATFWADHHATAFLNDSVRKDFLERQKSEPSTVVYDRNSESCAGLLWERFSDCKQSKKHRYYQTLVEWANKIDAADYESPQEAIFGQSPALRIDRSLLVAGDTDYLIFLIQALGSRKLESVARDPMVVARVKKADRKLRKGLERVMKSAKLVDGGIVVFDVTPRNEIISRYAPYYIFREAKYSIALVRSSNEAKITVMRNPWIDFPSIPLGELLLKYGGGGHQRVASLVLRNDEVREAPRIVDDVLEAIRVHVSY